MDGSWCRCIVLMELLFPIGKQSEWEKTASPTKQHGGWPVCEYRSVRRSRAAPLLWMCFATSAAVLRTCEETMGGIHLHWTCTEWGMGSTSCVTAALPVTDRTIHSHKGITSLELLHRCTKFICVRGVFYSPPLNGGSETYIVDGHNHDAMLCAVRCAKEQKKSTNFNFNGLLKIRVTKDVWLPFICKLLRFRSECRYCCCYSYQFKEHIPECMYVYMFISMQ